MALTRLEDIQDQFLLTETQREQQESVGVDEEEESLLSNLTADDVIETVAELVASFKCKTPKGREVFIERFKSSVRFPLTLIGFNKALRQMPIAKLPPTAVLVLGFVIMGVYAWIIKVEEPQEEQPKEQPKSQQEALKNLAVENVKQGTPPEMKEYEEYIKLAQSYMEGGKSE